MAPCVAVRDIGAACSVYLEAPCAARRENRCRFHFNEDRIAIVVNTWVRSSGFIEDMQTGWQSMLTAPMNGPRLQEKVKVSLENRKLWKQFHAETTEMIITKSGR